MVAVASIPTTPEDVAAAYAAKDLSPVSLGDLMLRCRREQGISQQELARRSGITPGTLHHFEAVALMPEPYRGLTHTGKLAFKTARALTALVNDPRFTEIAALFVSRRLSSTYIEAVARMAKLHPKAEVDEVVALAFTRARKQPSDWVGPVVVARRPRGGPKAVQAPTLALPGGVEAGGGEGRGGGGRGAGGGWTRRRCKPTSSHSLVRSKRGGCRNGARSTGCR